MPQIHANFIKLFADGVVEYPTQSASLLAPYTDAKGKSTGKPRTDLSTGRRSSRTFVQRADQDNFNVHIHVIGDRATRMALDAFAAAREKGSKRLYSLAHLEMIDPADAPRFKALDVIACFQLQWARPDNYTEEAVLPYIGKERQARLYPAGMLAKAGATISGGSDWNVSTFNPFEAMSIAMSRTNPAEPQRGALGPPEEKLTYRQMLEAYTVNAARQLGFEKEIGSIETGKIADLVILDRKLGDGSSAADVLTTKVRYTFAGGAQLIGPPVTSRDAFSARAEVRVRRHPGAHPGGRSGRRRSALPARRSCPGPRDVNMQGLLGALLIKLESSRRSRAAAAARDRGCAELREAPRGPRRAAAAEGAAASRPCRYLEKATRLDPKLEQAWFTWRRRTCSWAAGPMPTPRSRSASISRPSAR